MREFVELADIPAMPGAPQKAPWPRTTRLPPGGRGRSPFTGRAEALLAIGFRFWSGEKFGAAPTWSETARYIQADAAPTRIGVHVPPEIALVCDAKLVLRQLCDAAPPATGSGRAAPTGPTRSPKYGPTLTGRSPNRRECAKTTRQSIPRGSLAGR